MGSSALCFLLLCVRVCFPLPITGSHYSLCVSFSTSSLFLISFGFLSPLSPLHVRYFQPLATQNEGTLFPVPLGVAPPSASHNRLVTWGSQRWHTATQHPQWGLSELGGEAWDRCQLATERQRGLVGGMRAWQSDPPRAAWTCCGVCSASLDLCLAPCPREEVRTAFPRMLEELPMEAGCPPLLSRQTPGQLGWGAVPTLRHRHMHMHIHTQTEHSRHK